VLLAQEKYRDARSGHWRTHIDYDAFAARVARFYATGEAFGPEDYTAPTPAWAEWGAQEAGFAPGETRWRRGAGAGGAPGGGGGGGGGGV
jgi:tRNA wybutosine-synthesizing protein 1